MTLINPAEFPIRSSDLKLDLLTGAATDLGRQCLHNCEFSQHRLAWALYKLCRA